VIHDDDFEPDEQDEYDVADEVSLADTGRPWAARAIASHPMYAGTRKYLADNPLPRQREGGEAA
jgi:hypothetical protein